MVSKLTPLFAAVALFAVGYFVRPTQEVANAAVIFGGALYAVVLLTRQRSLIAAFTWFRRYPGRGLFVAALTLATAAMYLAKDADFTVTLLYAPLNFAFFWAFACVGTFFEERRIRKLVNAELAARSTANSGDAA